MLKLLLAAGAACVTLATVVVAGAAVPANTAPPTISGTAFVGQSLAGSDGTWDIDPVETSRTREWVRCDPGCTPGVVVGSGPSYSVGAGDTGKTLVYRVTVTNADGPVSADSAQTAAVQAEPVNTAAPVVNDLSPTVGQVLSYTAGTWTGTPTPSVTVQWCTPGCAAVLGSGASYTVQASDVGNQIIVRETASNSAATVTKDSAPTAAVPPVGPVNTAAPAVNDLSPTVGQVLSYTAGTWTGAPAPSVTAQWCTPGCAAVLGSGASYTVQAGDVGKQIIVRETAVNGGGTVTRDSGATAAVPPVGPVNTVAPVVNDTTPTVGQVLTYTAGTWTGAPPPSVTAQWCTPGCAAVLGTGASYTVKATDLGKQIIVRETAVNTGGTVTKDSAPTAAVPPVGPVNTVAPVVNDTTPTVAQVLSYTAGTWTGLPVPSLTAQWCTPGCAAVLGTGASYTVKATDVGNQIIVRETAVNTGGTVTKDSLATTAVAGPPVNTVVPAITGVAPPSVGQVLTGVSGTWTASPAPTLVHQWLRCNLSGASCVATGAPITTTTAFTPPATYTSSTTPYTPTSADLGSTLRLRVTANNGVGLAVVLESAPTQPVRGGPVNVPGQLPAVTGKTARGETMAATSGLWTGFAAQGQPPLAITHQWQRCPEDGNLADCVPVNASPPLVVNLTPAVAQTCSSLAPCGGSSEYKLTDADLGSRLRVVVTVANPVATAQVTTALTEVVVGAPIIKLLDGNPDPAAQPLVSGTAAQGLTLAASTGSWSAYPRDEALTYTYQWLRCSGATPESCSAVSGATSGYYLLGAADVGAQMRIRVTAKNGILPDGIASSAATAKVTGSTSGGGPGADLIIQLSTATSGSGVTYRLRVGNIGSSDADGVVVTATIPDGLQLVSATSTRGTCSGRVTCEIGQIKAGEFITVDIAFGSSQSGSFAFKATVTSTTRDVNPSNNSVSSSSQLTTIGAAPKSGVSTVVGVTGPSSMQLTVPLGEVSLKARRSGTTWVAATTFTLYSGKANLKLVVTQNGSTKPLTLLKGSRLGSATTTASATQIVLAAGKSATFPVKVILPAQGFSPKAVYVIRITGTATGGSSTLNIGFKGAALVTKTTTATPLGKTWIATSALAVPGGPRTAVRAWVTSVASAKKLTLLKGSRLGSAASAKGATVLATKTTKARVLPVRVLLPARSVAAGRTYVIRGEAKSPDGLWTDYEIRFKGKPRKAPVSVLAKP